jgi:hypothetical protein
MRYCESGQLQPAREPELSKNTCKVMFNSALANRQFLRYFLIGMTGSNHRNNIVLSRGKPMRLVRGFCVIFGKEIAQHLNKNCNSICTQPILVRQDAPDAHQHYLWGRSLGHDAKGSQPKSLDDMPFVNNVREQNGPHSGPGTHGAINQTGQGGVKEKDVRLDVPSQGEQSRPIGSLSDDIEARL